MFAVGPVDLDIHLTPLWTGTCVHLLEQSQKEFLLGPSLFSSLDVYEKEY